MAVFDTANTHDLVPESCTGEAIARLGQLLRRHGKKGAFVLRHYGDLDIAERELDEGCSGIYRSLEHFAEAYCERRGLLSQVPELLRDHIDFETFARDREEGGSLVVIECPEGYVMLWRD